MVEYLGDSRGEGFGHWRFQPNDSFCEANDLFYELHAPMRAAFQDNGAKGNDTTQIKELQAALADEASARKVAAWQYENRLKALEKRIKALTLEHDEALQELSKALCVAKRNNECSICLASVTDGSKLLVCAQCYHAVHASCGTKWASINNSCPMCKKKAPYVFKVRQSWWPQLQTIRCLARCSVAWFAFVGISAILINAINRPHGPAK